MQNHFNQKVLAQTLFDRREQSVQEACAVFRIAAVFIHSLSIGSAQNIVAADADAVIANALVQLELFDKLTDHALHHVLRKRLIAVLIAGCIVAPSAQQRIGIGHFNVGVDQQLGAIEMDVIAHGGVVVLVFHIRNIHRRHMSAIRALRRVDMLDGVGPFAHGNIGGAVPGTICKVGNKALGRVLLRSLNVVNG